MEHRMEHVKSNVPRSLLCETALSWLRGAQTGGSMAPETNTTPKRLKILGNDEIEALYGRPRFTPEERVHYFSLSERETAALAQFHTTKSRLYYILQLGYFKARHLFFVFSLSEVEADARYIQARYFPDFQFTDFEMTQVTRLRQRRLILALHNYRLCDVEERQKLATKARQAARISSKPLYVFRELIHYLAEHHLVTPSYSSMQDLVGQALTKEQARLITLVRNQLKQVDREALKRLLADTPGLYQITQLKREPKDFSLREIKREIERGQQINHPYRLAKKLLPALDISNESIKYYASLVTYYSVFRLKQLDENMRYFYLLCFIYHRYQRLHDNLLACLIYKVRGYTEQTKTAAKERVYQQRLDTNQALQKAGHVLKLFTDDTITHNTSFQEVQVKAFAILERQKLAAIADQMTTKIGFDETAFQWDHTDHLAHQIKVNLRPILSAVDLAASRTDAPLIEAVHFLKTAFEKGKPLNQYAQGAFPTRFIPDNIKRYLYTQDKGKQKHLLPDRYEFLVYRLLRNGLEAGDIFCRDSVRFRSFEDDLLDDQRWQQKETLLTNTGLTILQQPVQKHLAALEQQLEERLAAVNQRIVSGENQYFQFKNQNKQGRWSLQYPQASEAVNQPFFDQLRQVDIGNVLHFVNQHCQFMTAFDHVLGRYAKQTVDERVLTAALVAWGTNMGLGKMGENSDIGYQTLVAILDNFIRLETLREANDRISNAIAALPLFRQYALGETIHSSSDGQKFETRIHTLNARHSPKYFGLKKGVVSYTLVANHIPITTTIIGANEHESHYVFDLLYNNTTNIQPVIHSTDTHGTNEVNFAILHCFGYQFAPRYRDIYAKVNQSLYGFKHPSQYEGGPLIPIRKLNTNLISEEWDNFQRIKVSLALKTTTQSIIVGKVSAYARKNKTRRALWEYDNIIKSLYLLDYIDQPDLRRNVQHALNRGESYHKLRRAVSFANFGQLRFKTEHEQHLWNECSRLITNCILYYNI